MPESATFVVASYNVHQCVGTDRRYDPDRVAEVIRQLGADVVGLQEVDSHTVGGRLSFQMDYLAEACGMDAVAGPTIQRHDRRFGNVLLTCRPIRRVRRLDLTFSRREPRGALDVDIGLCGGTVRVVVTHLGLRPAERCMQARQLIRSLGSENGAQMVVLGDINEWHPLGRPLRLLRRRLGRAPAVRTFPSRFPLFPLDRVWTLPEGALVSVEAWRTAGAREASDHLPIRATIRCAPACEEAAEDGGGTVGSG